MVALHIINLLCDLSLNTFLVKACFMRYEFYLGKSKIPLLKGILTFPFFHYKNPLARSTFPFNLHEIAQATKRIRIKSLWKGSRQFVSQKALSIFFRHTYTHSGTDVHLQIQIYVYISVRCTNRDALAFIYTGIPVSIFPFPRTHFRHFILWTNTRSNWNERWGCI